jgi:hypothetical protein
MLKRFVSIILFFVLSAGVAIADDWVVSKMRGGVFVFKAGEWVLLKRGEVISDDSAIQTSKHARVILTRGKESISVAADTRIRIADKNGAKRTVVSQDFGEITVDVEKRNVQHFEVRTPILAAVVKGTRFVVKARGAEASIDVQRGRVEARDDRAGMKVDVMPRQSVELDKRDNPVLTVEGRGEKEPIRSTKNNKPLSVKQIITQAARAHPATPVDIEEVAKIAEQQGQSVSKSDLEFAAKIALKAAKRSGNAALVAKAMAQTNAVNSIDAPTTNAGVDVKAVKAQSKAAEAQAKAAKKQAEEALKEAKKSGDQAAIAAAAQAVQEATESEKAVKEENKEAENAAKEAEKAAKEAAEAAEKAAEAALQAKSDADKAAEEAAKAAEEAAKKQAEAAEKAAKEAAEAEKKAQEEAEKAAKQAAEEAEKAAKEAEKEKDKGVVGTVVDTASGLLGG